MRTRAIALGLSTAVALQFVLPARGAWSQACNRSCPPSRRDAHGCCPVPSARTGGGAASRASVPVVARGELRTQWTTSDAANWVEIPGLVAVLATRGGAVTVLANLNFNTVTVGAWANFTVFRGEQNLGDAQWGLQTTGGGPAEQNLAVTIAIVDTPPAGDARYSVRVRVGGGTCSISQHSPAILNAVELR